MLCHNFRYNFFNDKKNFELKKLIYISIILGIFLLLVIVIQPAIVAYSLIPSVAGLVCPGTYVHPGGEIELASDWLTRLGGIRHWTGVYGGSVNTQAEGTVIASLVSYTDYPLHHDSHDQNVILQLDPRYEGIASTANPQYNGHHRMDVEWEIGSINDGRTDRFALDYWPWEGDRAWMMGRLIWDCGHPPFKTEIHPPLAVAFTRIEPVIFSGETTPTLGSNTHIYLHGQGGYYNTPVGGQNYEFDVPLSDSIRSLFPNASFRTQVTVDPAYGGPAPIVTSIPADNPNRLHIVYPLSSIHPSPDNKFGAVVSAGWVGPSAGHDGYVQSSYPSFHRLRITFDSIRVNNDHDAGVAGAGEWNHLWAGVNGKWIELSGPSSHFDLDSVNSGEIRSFQGKSLEVVIPDGGSLKLQTTGWESDGMDDCFGAIVLGPVCVVPNNPIGIISKQYYGNQNYGTGIQHDDLSTVNTIENDPDTAGDFNLRYHIEETGRYYNAVLSSTPTHTQITSAIVTPTKGQSYTISNRGSLLGANSITFTFRGSNTFGTFAECRLIGTNLPQDNFRECTGNSNSNFPARYTGLSPGRYVFEVRGVDDFSRRESPPASFRFNVCAPEATTLINCFPSVLEQLSFATLNKIPAVIGSDLEKNDETGELVNYTLAHTNRR